LTLSLSLNIVVDKLETLKRYKFSLAFENSNEEDYVTEKFFQSLVAGIIEAYNKFNIAKLVIIVKP
jgi:Glycosyltransferase family 10 (fucosyltransferase) C-term